MKVKRFLFIFISFVFLSGCVKKYHPQITPTEMNGEKMLLGDIQYHDILYFFPRWQEADQSIKIDPELVNAVNKIDQPVEVICYLGTWCSDSRHGVPLFVKTLQKANNRNIKFEIIAVDRQKDDPEHRALQNDIQRVPTFVLYRQETEIGRMIEFPMESNFVEDFLDFLKSN